MAKFCQMCDTKLSFFSCGQLCNECSQDHFVEWQTVKNDIKSLAGFTDERLENLRKFGKIPLIKLYSKLYEEFESDKELDETEIETLNRTQKQFDLTSDEIEYNNRVLPYIYVNNIRKTGKLPVANLNLDVSVNFKKDEVTHFGSFATVGELRSVRVGYQSGSRGVSIRVMKGVSFRAGAHRGHVIKEDRIVDKSQGTLIITNKRLFLVPSAGKKPVNIALNKIHYHRCYEDYLEVNKEGREKSHYFKMQPGAVTISGICLGELAGQA